MCLEIFASSFMQFPPKLLRDLYASFLRTFNAPCVQFLHYFCDTYFNDVKYVPSAAPNVLQAVSHTRVAILWDSPLMMTWCACAHSGGSLPRHGKRQETTLAGKIMIVCARYVALPIQN